MTAHRQIFDVEDFGAVAGVATPAARAANARTISAAMQAAQNAGPGAEVVFPLGVYHTDTPTMPRVAPSGIGFRFGLRGSGAAVNRTTAIRFYPTPGQGNVSGFDFSGADHAKIRSLLIEHAGPIQASNGIGIKFDESNHVEIDDVWVEGFDVNVQHQGFSLYSKYVGLRSMAAYSAGMKWLGALHNGNTFLACLFSKSVNGSGVIVEGSGGTATVVFRSCFFEGNHVYGFAQTGPGFLGIKFDGCYAEANGDWDYYLSNSLAASAPEVVFDTCYWDSNNPPASPGAGFRFTQHRRIEVRGAKVTLLHCRFYQMAGTTNPYVEPPVRVVDHAGGMRATRPCVAINCEYETASLCSDMTGWVVIDSKHPFTTYSDTTPLATNAHALQQGSFQFNTLEATTDHTLGYFVKTGGKGAAADPVETVRAVAGSQILTPSDSGHPLTAGDLIQVAGTTFNRAPKGSATENWAKVINVPNGAIVVDGLANSDVAAGAVSYRKATVAEVGMVVRYLSDAKIPVASTISFTPQGRYGLHTLSETQNTGHSALIMLSNGALYLFGQTGTHYVIDNGLTTAAKINVGYVGSEVVIRNNLAAPVTVSVSGVPSQ